MEFQNIIKKMSERQKNKQKRIHEYISVINGMELYTHVVTRSDPGFVM